MIEVYAPCICGSAKKFKFCCSILQSKDSSKLAPMTNQWPVIQCFMGDNWKEQGMGSVSIVRKMPHGPLCLAVYLIDTWCLGVKDAFFKTNLSEQEVNDTLRGQRASQPMIKVSYKDARCFILGGLAYAQSIGIPPHKDWELAKYAIEAHLPFENKFVFGKDGLPFYVNGPYDSAQVKKFYIQKAVAAGGSSALINPDSLVLQ